MNSSTALNFGEMCVYVEIILVIFWGGNKSDVGGEVWKILPFKRSFGESKGTLWNN